MAPSAKRDISRAQLIKGTVDEWQRQGISYEDSRLTQLETLWPNINKGDALLLNIDAKGISQFFYNQTFIDRINGAAFTDAFTRIWLSENTLKPALHNQLIGFTP